MKACLAVTGERSRDAGNCILINFDFSADLDMVVRDDNGNVLDINQTSTTQLYEHHVRAANRIRRATVSNERVIQPRKFN